MTPVGETLRRERMKRNVDLEEIADELKISKRFLQAIESDQYDKLPGGVFAKSFVLQYARLLGLDESVIAGQLQQALAPEADVAHLAEKPKTARVSSVPLPKVEAWEAVGDGPFRWSGWLSAGVLVAVTLICSAVYAWIQRPKTTVTASHPVTQTSAQPAAPPAATQPDAQPPATAPSPSPETPAPPPAQPAAQATAEPKPAELPPAPSEAAVAAPNPDATVHVEIVAEEVVWVLARADGKYIFSGTMEAHTTRTVEGIKDVIVRLGNAAAVTISLNGKPIGPAGPKGQVRTLQFTSGGFQIVPPKPVSIDPFDRL